MPSREFTHATQRSFSPFARSTDRPLRPAARTTARLVLPAPAQDPHVLRHDGGYYYCESSPSGLYVRCASDFLEFGGASRRCVWTPPSRGPTSRNLWAPELHDIDGRHYIYFAADDGHNARHRMWVLGATSSDPAGDYELLGPLDTQGWAIDGSTFTDTFGDRYFVWSGWPGDRDGRQNLYLARMKNPAELDGSRVLLASPDQPWEQHAMPICEGPQTLQRGDARFSSIPPAARGPRTTALACSSTSAVT